MLKKPAIWAEIGEIDGFIAIFYSSKMKWKSNFSKSLNSSNLSWFNWIVFWILHSKRLQKTCVLQNCKKNHELHTLNMLCAIIFEIIFKLHFFSFFFSFLMGDFFATYSSTTCSEYGAHDFFSNSVRCMFSEASCYVEFKTLFR